MVRMIPIALGDYRTISGNPTHEQYGHHVPGSQELIRRMGKEGANRENETPNKTKKRDSDPGNGGQGKIG